MYDRARYLGDNSFNPCLYSGFSIFVPTRSEAVVHVIGEVVRPRTVELLPGDDTELLISLAGGLTRHADRKELSVYSNSKEAKARINLKSGSVIRVAAKETDKDELSVYGEVKKPGRYAFQRGATLEELIKNSGGFSPQANHEAVIIFRTATLDQWGRRSDKRFPIQTGAAHSKDYGGVVLSPRDSVFVPARVGYVMVQGQVNVQGRFPYFDGKNISFYVNAAGGILPEGDNQAVILRRPISGVSSLSSFSARAFDGDEITVRRREARR